jgi:hypothetical protein
VGGEHRGHLQPVEQGGQAVGAGGLGDLLDGGRERLPHRPAGQVALAQGPDPVLLLGQVDQLEVDREGLGQQLGPVQVEGGDQLHHPGPRLAPVAVGRAQLDGRPAQPLHVGQQPRPPGLLQDLPEQPPEQADVAAQRRRGRLRPAPLLSPEGGHQRAARPAVVRH